MVMFVNLFIFAQVGSILAYLLVPVAVGMAFGVVWYKHSIRHMYDPEWVRGQYLSNIKNGVYEKEDSTPG